MVVIGAAVAVLVGVVVTRLLRHRPSAGAHALRYLDAIARGDGATASELFDPDAIDRRGFAHPTDDSLLRLPAPAGAIELISAVSIDRVSWAATGSAAIVTASFSLRGERHEAIVTLKWLDRRWVITSGLWAVFQPRSADSLPATTIALGAHAAARPELTAHRGVFLAYPGVYPLVVVTPAATTAIEIALVGGSRLVGVELELD